MGVGSGVDEGSAVGVAVLGTAVAVVAGVVAAGPHAAASRRIETRMALRMWSRLVLDCFGDRASIRSSIFDIQSRR